MQCGTDHSVTDIPACKMLPSITRQTGIAEIQSNSHLQHIIPGHRHGMDWGMQVQPCFARGHSFVIVGRGPAYSEPQCRDRTVVLCACPGRGGKLVGSHNLAGQIQLWPTGPKKMGPA